LYFGTASLRFTALVYKLFKLFWLDLYFSIQTDNLAQENVHGRIGEMRPGKPNAISPLSYLPALQYIANVQ
jgi:hypothetical protein